MVITCLVNRGPSSFVLKLTGDTLVHLREAMAAHSSLRTVEECAVVQVHNKTFDTYVNVDENTLLEENSIIRVMDVTIIAEAGTSASVTDPYPGHLYAVAARELVLKYPQLKDACGEGHLDLNRQKAQKRKAAQSERGGSAVKAVKPCVRKAAFWNAAFDEGEDERSLNCHIDIMKRELRKAGGSFEKIQESMIKTFRSRRSLIETATLSLAQLLDTYPALRLHNEFQRLTGTFARESLGDLIERRGDRILSVLQKGSKLHVEDLDDSNSYVVAVLTSLPRIVKEDPSAILSPLVPGAMSAHPHLFYSGDKPEASSTFLVTFEDLKLTAVDITDGFALLLAAYWAFNVQYAQKAKRTFLLLETLMGMEPSSLLPCVVKAATAIDSA
ncbi:hypothetical protein HPB49_015065 [Dermacentor silvarum]|uniref:Uncharacterized protein n=1 Tax=Dermacentor silvarum TaxID=543639 RepID=A0ACB8DE32_DERSI|nr:hypothetical protein HPB49_015065 [Dermacentor silvarum]